MGDLLEKIKELWPVKIGDNFIGIVEEGAEFEFNCKGYTIRNNGVYLLTTYDMEFEFPNEVKIIK